MGLTEFTLRLLLLFFPGIVCFLIVDALTVHRERKTHEVIFFTLLFGLISYFVHAVVLEVVGIRFYRVEGFPGLWIMSVSTGPAFFGSLTDAKVEIDFWEIFWVAIWAVLLAFLIAFCHNRYYLHKFAKRWGITEKFGDPNVWSYAFNAKNADWCVVRDIPNKLMFQGRIEAFSDVEEHAELILEDVIVYNEATSEECYRAQRIYLARKREDITVEFQNPGDSNAKPAEQNDPVAGSGNAEGGSQSSEGRQPAPETGRELPAKWQSKLWRQWQEFTEQWRKFRKVKPKK